MNYQKTYMNHIHSSSLLCQLSTMWKSQTLCDAVIRAGNNITRAHRVVLVAACPMLQSMENAAAGSHLEVRVASDIKQESIHTFLQYLYEGFMTLTEENCRDVEKVARLLQVDGVIKCCADFHKCMDSSSAGQYKYSLLDQIEFRHVRTTELAKCQERVSKRPSEGRHSPEGKRQRIQRPSSPPSNHSSTHKVHDMHSMSESYMPDVNAPWDRVPHVGAGAAPNRFGNQPGVIDIVEDSLELIQTEPPGKHPGDSNKDSRRIQQSVGISVASQHNTGADLQIVNVTGNSNQNVSNNPPRSISDNMNIDNSPSSSSSSSFKESSNRPTDRPGGPPPPQLQRMEPSRQPAHGTINLIDIPQSPEHDSNIGSRQSQARPSENFPTTSTPQRAAPFPVSLTAVPRGTANFQSKPFAAGSATQAEASSPRGQKPSALGGGEMASPIERAKETGNKGKQDITDSGPDISIVKVEHNSGNMASDSTGGLDMFVSEGMTVTTANQRATEEEEQSEYELEEPPGDMSHGDMSNDGAGDQSENWYMGNIKGPSVDVGAVPQQITNFTKCVPISRSNSSSWKSKEHMQDTANLTVICMICSAIFNTQSDLQQHLQSHVHQFVQKVDRTVCRCVPCNKEFKSKHGYNIHRKMYHSERTNLPTCQVCNKAFSSRTHLATHMVSHSGQRNFKCQYCKKTYKLKHHLKNHICVVRDGKM